MKTGIINGTFVGNDAKFDGHLDSPGVENMLFETEILVSGRKTKHRLGTVSDDRHFLVTSVLFIVIDAPEKGHISGAQLGCNADCNDIIAKTNLKFLKKKHQTFRKVLFKGQLVPPGSDIDIKLGRTNTCKGMKILVCLSGLHIEVPE